MATLTASAALARSPAKFSINRDIRVVREYALTAALSAGDQINMMKIPAGAVVTDVAIGCESWTGVATVSFGHTGNLSAFIASAVLSGLAGTIVRATIGTGLGYSASVETTLAAKVEAVSDAPAAGKFKVAVSYTLDNP